MRTRIAFLSAFLLLFAGQMLLAQVSGVVKDASGFPDAGAEVSVKGKDTSTLTDDNGAFTIDAVVGEDVLVIFPSDGRASWEVNVSSANLGTISNTKSLSLNEVVVLGYDQSTTKAKSIGASATVSSAELTNRPNYSVLNSLQGQAPGLAINSLSGSPGSARINALIRGVSSINASTEPLYVIDGVPTNSTQFRNLNPEEIDNIAVLKDASSTSIYGNRGANGVILINTKRGSFNTPLTVTTSMITGFSTLPSNDYNLSNARELLTLQNRTGVGLGATLTEAEIAGFQTDTDWLDEFFSVGVTQQYNIGLNSGGEKFRQSTNVGYFTQDGQVETTDFQRFTVRTNLGGKSDNDKFSYEVNLGLGYSTRNQLQVETRSGINFNTIQNPLLGAIVALPYEGPSPFATGQELLDAIGADFSGINDTRVLEDYLRPGNYPSRRNEFSLLANANLRYNFTSNIAVNQKLGVDYRSSDGYFARAPQSYLALIVQQNRGEAFGGIEDLFSTIDNTLYSVTSAHYDNTFSDDHTVGVGVYYEINRGNRNGRNQSQDGLDPRTYVPGAGTGYVPFDPANPNSFVPNISAFENIATTISYFASVNYDYQGKFGLDGVIRRDGSYRFAPENRWGTFWSVGGRINLDKFGFMANSPFQLLKLRGSYGTQGNQNLVALVAGANPIFAGANLSRDLFVETTGYQNQPAFGLVLGNSTLGWEEIDQANIGLDFIVFNSRLEGNIDVYQKETSELFNTIDLSAATGQTSVNGNDGILRNQGVELNLRYALIRSNDFRLNIWGNTSYNDNQVRRIIGDVDRTGDLINQVGNPVSSWNLIRYAGVNQANGNLLFLNADGNPTENPTDGDRVATDRTFIPKWVGGFGFDADYKGFFLDVQFSYQADVWKWDNQFVTVYNATPNGIANGNVSADLLNAWTPTNPSNFPRINADNLLRQNDSDRFLFDASFIRLRNVSAGYNFSKDLLKGSGISALRLFVQGENLAVFTKWRGFDPEGFTTFPVGIYPNPRTISFGANISF